MKKTLITSLILCLWTVLCPAYAAVEMDYQDTITTITTLGVERNLFINSNDDERYRIEVRPMSSMVTNAGGNVEIPISYFAINNNTQDIDFVDNEFSTLFNNVVMNNIPRIVTAKIKNYGMVPRGTYSIGLQIQATNLDTGEVISTMFNLQFVVRKFQKITSSLTGSDFRLSASNALTKNARVTNEANLPITINSNCDWALVVKTDSRYGETPGDYYVRTIGATPGVTQRLQEGVLLEEDKEIILARGKAPASNEEVTIQYVLQNKDGKFIPSGSYNNNVKYVIREDR